MRAGAYDLHFSQLNCVQSDVHEKLKQNFSFKKLLCRYTSPKEVAALREIARIGKSTAVHDTIYYLIV